MSLSPDGKEIERTLLGADLWSASQPEHFTLLLSLRQAGLLSRLWLECECGEISGLFSKLKPALG